MICAVRHINLQMRIVGARLARESGASVPRIYRVIVLREQARLQQVQLPLERGLPANQAPRCPRFTVLSFFASKLGSNRFSFRRSEACPRIRRLGAPDLPRHRSSPASRAPTGRCLLRDSAASGRRGICCYGNSITNRVTPWADSQRIVPPWAWMIERVIARPNPACSLLSRRAGSAR